MAQTSANWLSGGLFQRQIVLQAAPSFGQPRPSSRLGRAGRGDTGIVLHMVPHRAVGGGAAVHLRRPLLLLLLRPAQRRPSWYGHDSMRVEISLAAPRLHRWCPHPRVTVRLRHRVDEVRLGLGLGLGLGLWLGSG